MKDNFRLKPQKFWSISLTKGAKMDKYQQENGIRYARYSLEVDLLCLGERMRASTFRPCLKVFTTTSLVGALNARFPAHYRPFVASARFISFRAESLVYSPRDRVHNVSKVPLQIEYLADVKAEMHLQLNDFTCKEMPEEFELQLGGMKSSGFGRCRVTLEETSIDPGNPEVGDLAVRCLHDQKALEQWGFRNVIHP